MKKVTIFDQKLEYLKLWNVTDYPFIAVVNGWLGLVNEGPGLVKDGQGYFLLMAMNFLVMARKTFFLLKTVKTVFFLVFIAHLVWSTA